MLDNHIFKVVKVISQRSITKIRSWLTQSCKGKPEKVFFCLVEGWIYFGLLEGGDFWVNPRQL
jgi:hypothetical protein